MNFPRQHDLHKRRMGRNFGVGIVLLGFVVIVFGLTVVKVTRGEPMQAFDHVSRPELTEPVN
ncbi:hypothetical protein SAMN05421688_1210 [Poseidonocella pacifica]|uniref:Cytochrome C oxidase assembly protein n=1 Tax=Poseidonocella pacifica TaxID=871651 RepID=A0A1I0WAX8_9RHOB|nr:hypothetical protein [Poseidonocella pacifica]SFA85754.1 hypothetical protein SAMN05421688_1210 [Poseidonocella pacifica]